MTTRAHIEFCQSGDPRWNELLAQVPHDVFHRPEYHRLSGFGHQGTPYLFAYREEGGALFAWPYLLRAIPDTGFNDVSSVYGYAGPVGSGSPEFFERAWRELSAHWRDQRAVSAFTRFHPLMSNEMLLAGQSAEGLIGSGSTVSIDLTLSSEEQVRRYRKVLRQEIRQARENGFETEEDTAWTGVPAFVRLYRETMERRQSRPDYLVDEDWVAQFREALDPHARLFVTRWKGEVAAALLAIEYGPFLHAHLTGINSELSVHSPLKVLLDDIREWGTRRGLRSFHLGGGLGGREDSLFQFKRRFSPVTHNFQTGRWVLDPPSYRELAEARREDLAAQGYRIGNPEFFPLYRYEPTPADATDQDGREAESSYALVSSGG